MVKLRKQQQECQHCQCKEQQQQQLQQANVKKLRRHKALLRTPAAWVVLATTLLMGYFMVHFRPQEESTTDRTLTQATTTTSSRLASLPSITDKNLTLQDFQLVKYLGRGQINVAFRARLRDAQVAQQYGLWDDANNQARPVVVKLADTHEYGHAEMESLERMSRIDQEKAQAVGLMQAIWAARDVSNPYYCTLVKSRAATRWNDGLCPHHEMLYLVKDMETKVLARIRVQKTIDVIVLPYFEERYIDKTAKSFRDNKIFFQSMLEQLMVAHEGGANNLDLQIKRNMYVDRDTGRAILFDWNSYIAVGAPARDPHQSWHVAAPEAWLYDYGHINALNLNIHGQDIWQAGICWINFLYAPCKWESARVLSEGKSKTEKREFWKKVIHALGGNTVIPISATETVDAREFAGLSTQQDFPCPRPPISSPC